MVATCAFRHTLTQVFQHGKESWIQCFSVVTAFVSTLYIIVLKLLVGNDHERGWILQITLAGGSQLQESIVLYILLEITGYQCLADYRIPYLGIHILTGSKLFQVVVLVGNDVVGGTAFHEIDDVLLTEVFLHGSHSLQTTIRASLASNFTEGCRQLSQLWQFSTSYSSPK